MKQEKNLWQKTRMELLRDLACSDAGLTAAEAGKRLAKFGPNELQGGRRKSTLRIFFQQFADFLVIILILAAVVSAIFGAEDPGRATAELRKLSAQMVAVHE